MLRFIHINSLSASGWIRIDKNKCIFDENISNETMALEDYIIDYRNIRSIEKEQICPLRLASYDIEADSSHGDFPVAKKNYKKLIQEKLKVMAR